MKILFISNYSELYGANRSLLLLLDGLVENKIKPLVIVPRYGKFVDELKKRNIPCRIITFKSWMGVRDKLYPVKVALRFLVNIISLPFLLFYALKFKPSVIYTNTSVTPVGIYLSLLLKVPHIWHIRELGNLHYNFSYDFGQKYFMHFMRKSDAIITISEFVKKTLFSDDWKNLTVINNGVVSENVTEDYTKGKTHSENFFTFLIIGLIHPSKGIHDAIEALGIVKKDINNVRLVIYGETNDKLYRNRLENLIMKLNLNEEVSFNGFVDKPFEIYKRVDAVLVCSRNEAWGRVAAEAMVSEKPVIGYNSGGTIEIIIDNYNGLLYNNVEELVERMKDVIINQDLVKNLTKNAKRLALEQFSGEVYTSNILNIINKVIKF